MTHLLRLCVFFIGLTTCSLFAEQPSSAAQADKNIDMDRLSEAFGYFIGKNLKSPGLSFNLEKVILGIRNGAAGKEAPMSDQEYTNMMALVQLKAYNQLAEKNLKEANAFLEKNKKDPQVKELEEGKLQYQVLHVGKGEEVKEDATPKFHYVGQYLNDEVFSSSLENGEPVTISLKQMIPGFRKGVVGMKEGEKRRLYIHPDLGYGTSGQLQPNALLIFDVEILKANEKQKEPNKKTGE